MRFWHFLLLGILVFALTGVNEAQATPTFQAAGAEAAGQGTVKPAWPVHQIDDIALLFIETSGTDAAVLTTPAGFVAVTNSPQATGTSPAGTRITVFWARATSTAMAMPVIGPTQHTYARILTYRGVINTGDPWDVTGGGVKAAASTSVTVTGVTTTLLNTLIVQAVARDNDSDVAAFSVQTNTNLTSITERSDGGTTAGDGGGFAVWDDVKATAGATGNTTATVTSSINAFLTIALKPLQQPPTVAKSFSPATIATGGTSTLTITLTNPNATAITGATFTDTYPANLVNAGSPALSNSCGGTPTAAASGTSLALSGGTISGNSSCTVSVAVTSAVAGSYLNSTGLVTTTIAGSGTAATATLTVTSAAPGSFNAFETSTAADAITGVIKTKIAGSAFSLDVVAISGGAQASTFTNTVKVELLGNATTGISLDVNNCPTSFTLLQTVSPNPTITSGRSTVNFAAVSNAWKDVRVRISFPTTTPTVTSCSTDNFAIRPNSLSFTVTDGNWETAGATRTLDNALTSGGTVHKAGRPFTITVTGYNGASTPAITANYAGTPTASIASHTIPTSCLNSTACTLDGGTFTDGTANDGIVSSATASYAEVGVFNMQLVDTSFANVDASDSTTAERYITSGTVAVGRFVPDHFSLSSGSRTPACTTGGAVLSYMNQPFTLAATLVAQNFAGGTTENYHPSSGGYAPAAVVWQVENADSGTNLNSAGTRLTNVTGAWSNGSYVVNSATATFIRLGSPDGPYDSLQLGVQLTDPDGPVLGALDMNAATSGTCAPCTAKTVGASISARFGRLRLLNAYGSELLALPVPLEAQYWAGSYYVTNTADSCTVIPMSSITMGNYLKQLNACETQLSPVGNATVVAGKLPGAGLILTKPGTGNAGSVDLALNVSAIAAGNTCVGATESAATAANMPWFGPNQGARATFGIYKSPLIYRRENY